MSQHARNVGERQGWQDACGRVHHDLKAMARNIAQLSEWISGDLAEASVETPKSVSTCLDQLDRLGSHLQSYSAGIDRYLRAGAFGPGICDPGPILDDVLESYFAGSPLTVSRKFSSETFPVPESDLTILLQVLLSNVLIHSQMDPPAAIVSVTASTASVHLCVQDCGVGIADTHRADAVEFGRSLGRHADTNGFGLAIAAKICAAHSGSLSLSNREDVPGGLSVHLSFPEMSVHATPQMAQ